MLPKPHYIAFRAYYSARRTAKMAGIGVKLTLLVFSLLGLWTLWGFPLRNNLLHFLGELSELGASIPGPTYAPMKQTYTGLARVDRQLTTLVGFFYTAVDGNRLDISLTFLNLGSQVLAAWMLITTESYRVGNRNSFVITSWVAPTQNNERKLT